MPIIGLTCPSSKLGPMPALQVNDTCMCTERWDPRPVVVLSLAPFLASLCLALALGQLVLRQ
eukprot:1711742-Heterocapsa_arctica.AAC.1